MAAQLILRLPLGGFGLFAPERRPEVGPKHLQRDAGELRNRPRSAGWDPVPAPLADAGGLNQCGPRELCHAAGSLDRKVNLWPHGRLNSPRLSRGASTKLASGEAPFLTNGHRRAMTIADRLRVLRQRRGVGQAEVAAAAGVAVPTVSEWESGKKKPSRNSLQRLATFYNVAVDVLLSEIPVVGERAQTDRENELLLAFRTAAPEMQEAVLTILRRARTRDN